MDLNSFVLLNFNKYCIACDENKFAFYPNPNIKYIILYKTNYQKGPQMKFKKLLFMITIALLFVSSSSVMAAGDFKWMENFNIRADADPLGFRTKLATRFKIGDAQIDAVLKVVTTAAEAYMILRCGEMSEKSTPDVVKKYESKKNKGWRVLAKSLGIKPGSKEFQDLKHDDDLYSDKGKSEAKSKDKGKNKGKGKNKN